RIAFRAARGRHRPRRVPGPLAFGPAAVEPPPQHLRAHERELLAAERLEAAPVLLERRRDLGFAHDLEQPGGRVAREHALRVRRENLLDGRAALLVALREQLLEL